MPTKPGSRSIILSPHAGDSCLRSRFLDIRRTVPWLRQHCHCTNKPENKIQSSRLRRRGSSVPSSVVTGYVCSCSCSCQYIQSIPVLPSPPLQFTEFECQSRSQICAYHLMLMLGYICAAEGSISHPLLPSFSMVAHSIRLLPLIAWE